MGLGLRFPAEFTDPRRGGARNPFEVVGLRSELEGVIDIDLARGDGQPIMDISMSSDKPREEYLFELDRIVSSAGVVGDIIDKTLMELVRVGDLILAVGTASD